MIAHREGHTAVHDAGIHGGARARIVAIAAAVAFVFGVSVLLAEAFVSVRFGAGSGHTAVVD